MVQQLRLAAVATIVGMATGVVLVLAESPVEAAPACWGQSRVEVVPAGGTLSCDATQPLPRDGKNTGQSSNPQFTAFASIVTDGVTVTVTASGAPDGWMLLVASQRGISGGVREGQGSSVFSGGSATVTVELQCGQVDVHAVPPDFSGDRAVWRIAGPYMTNAWDCATQPVTTTTAAPTSTTAPTTTPNTPPTTGSNTSVAQSTTTRATVSPVQALPSTGRGTPTAAVLIAFIAVVAGAGIVVASRRSQGQAG
jgi:LPXTG-motif cell wall-anchored protein